MSPDSATGLVVGTGDFVYDVFRPWGVLPDGGTFGVISHVAVDSKEHVPRANHPVAETCLPQPQDDQAL